MQMISMIVRWLAEGLEFSLILAMGSFQLEGQVGQVRRSGKGVSGTSSFQVYLCSGRMSPYIQSTAAFSSVSLFPAIS